ncbi:hypothetical protein OHC33_000894 [Knufia fluminis]|uniref:DUF6604 domain-containing protein n=1 Tax=Knufia fluminis TaxID=191047 RepID=A0AAN8EWJ7_9EURO|nr:hypothetical protein OHC33_000894 [Knufia fluminis]
MEIPSEFFRAYRIYKRKEKYLLAWIDAMVRLCGYVITSKGKLEAQTETSKHKASATTIELIIYDILPAIKLIASSPKIPSVPLEVQEVLLEILDLRSQCVSWFKANTFEDDDNTQQSNTRHEYVVRVLKAVVSALRHKMTDRVENESELKSSSEADHTTSHGDGTIPSASPERPSSDRSDHESYTTIKGGLSDEEKQQEEYNFRRFYLINFCEKMEDTVVPEIIRFSRNQDDGRDLGLLITCAIDIVQRADRELSLAYGDDYKRRELKFLEAINFSKLIINWTSPYLRTRTALVVQYFTKGTSLSPEEMADPKSPFSASAAEEMQYVLAFLQRTLNRQRDSSTIASGLVLDAASFRLRRYIAQVRLREQPTVDDLSLANVLAIRLNVLMYYIMGDDDNVMTTLLQRSAQTVRVESSVQKAVWARPGHGLSRKADARDMVLANCQLRNDTTDDILQGYESKRYLLEERPLLCAINAFNLNFERALDARNVIELSGIVALVTHMFNILREENLLSLDWSDLDFVLAHGGTEFLYQNERPTKAKRATFAGRLLFATGIKETDYVTSATSNQRVYNEGGKVIGRKKMPLSDTLMQRIQASFGDKNAKYHELGSTDAQLIVCTTVLPELFGMPPARVRITDDHQIEGRPQLWKLADRGLKPDAQLLLALIKRGLQNENAAYKFKWFAFEQACCRLIERLVTAWEREGAEGMTIVKTKKTTAGVGPQVEAAPTTLDRARHAAQWAVGLSKRYHEKKSREEYIRLLQIATKVFEEWLPANSSVGLEGTRQTSPPKHVSTLRPDIRERLRQIVAKYGLQDDMFTDAQRTGVDFLQKTVTLLDKAKDALAKQNSGSQEDDKSKEELKELRRKFKALLQMTQSGAEHDVEQKSKQETEHQ